MNKFKGQFIGKTLAELAVGGAGIQGAKTAMTVLGFANGWHAIQSPKKFTRRRLCGLCSAAYAACHRRCRYPLVDRRHTGAGSGIYYCSCCPHATGGNLLNTRMI